MTDIKYALKKIILTAFAFTVFSANAATDSGPAPDFTLKSNTGENLRLAEQAGNVVMLNFWASWCTPCRAEMPHLNALSDKYKDYGFTLYGINVDDSHKDAVRAIERLKVQFPVLFDAEDKVVDLFNVDAMPTTVLIDRDGQIRHLHKGYKKGYELEYDEQVGALVME